MPVFMNLETGCILTLLSTLHDFRSRETFSRLETRRE